MNTLVVGVGGTPHPFSPRPQGRVKSLVPKGTKGNVTPNKGGDILIPYSIFHIPYSLFFIPHIQIDHHVSQ